MEENLQKQLQEINQNLKEVNRKTGSSVWRSFFTGALSGLGSVVGVAIALAIIAWILNTVGVIPALRNQVNLWQHTLDQLQKNK